MDRNHATGPVVIIYCLGCTAEVKLVMLVILSLSSALGAAKEVTVLLVSEVDIVVSVRMRELGWVIPVILPS